MFGFIWMQPIHASLRDMRIVQLALIISGQYMLFKILDQISAIDDPTTQIGAYASISIAQLTQMWACISSLQKPNKRDE